MRILEIVGQITPGRVGTGFPLRLRSELQKQLEKLSRATSPLVAVPKDSGLRAAHWTEPKLIAEVAFIEWTSDRSIRHPSFQGLRDDKSPKEVVREIANALAKEPEASGEAYRTIKNLRKTAVAATLGFVQVKFISS